MQVFPIGKSPIKKFYVYNTEILTVVEDISDLQYELM
jgi:hypothetical protein